MVYWSLEAFHRMHQAEVGRVNDTPMVLDYGDIGAEYGALREGAGLLDFSSRGRLCLTGRDRQPFLNGQVTNNVKDLRVGQGCYAALVNAKARMQSDLRIHVLEEEILLDCEPGFGGVVAKRLEQFIIAEEVQVIDASPHYAMLSVQGPSAEVVVRAWGWTGEWPGSVFDVRAWSHPRLGLLYLVNQPRLGQAGFDVYVPLAGVEQLAKALGGVAAAHGGRWCGWRAFEICRVEAGIPRFGVDMDETNLAPEAGIEASAISYTKGCYIGQEIIARIRTYGQVARALRRLRLSDGLEQLPAPGSKLVHGGKEVGYLTSLVSLPGRPDRPALGYVRKEFNAPGTRLEVLIKGSPQGVVVVGPPQGG